MCGTDFVILLEYINEMTSFLLIYKIKTIKDYIFVDNLVKYTLYKFLIKLES